MRFSEQFEIARSSDDDWFDPLLTSDTRLFVDPFLIFEEETGEWERAHEELIEFFNMVLGLIARSRFQRGSAHWKAAERLLMFPEPAEFCLGMAEGSVQGAGSAEVLRDEMLAGCVEAIRAGLTEVEHFEELTLFGPGIGVDRISDIGCNVLKSRFIAYTHAVAQRHGIEMEQVGVKHASWSREFRRWSNSVVPLPRNPAINKGVLLTPDRFLREIPIIEPSGFWDWSWSNHNEDLRDDFNYDIGRNVDAREIVRLARRHPELVRSFVREKEDEGAEPYNFNQDASMTQWYERGAELAATHPLAVPSPEESGFCDFVEGIVQNFKHAIEQTDAWRLVWSDAGRPRPERVVQALFRSVVLHYCRASDIDLSGEANAGKGPVDFKFSSGWRARAVVEIKLANNSKYWHGLHKQTPQYMRSEEVRCGFFVTVGFRDVDFSDERRDRARDAVEAVKAREDVELRLVDIDAREKPSASKGG